MNNDFNQSIKNLTFEEALQELEDITQQMEAHALSLEKSLEVYERGCLLKKRCQELLEQAESKIEYLKEQDGAIVKVKLDESENLRDPFEQSRLFQEKSKS